MRLLYLGDVMGSAGRRAVTERLAGLRTEWNLDFVVVNAENATSGRGVSAAHARDLLAAGADCLTLGDHAFDQREMIAFIETEPRILRPLNYARKAPGRGHRVFDDARGRKVLVAQTLGRVFMKPEFNDPFPALDAALQAHTLGGAVQAALVDMHCEATSEKMATGLFCDGRASAVVGSHTHIPTADTQILPGGTAFQADAGMCGDYLSVIGMDPEAPMRRFLDGMPAGRMTPATGEATLCGLFVETDDATGLAARAAPVRLGGRLAQAAP